MESVLFQLIGGDSPISIIIWIAFMVIFFLFYPRIMLSQMMWKLEKSAKELEVMSDKSKRIVIKAISKNPDKKIRDSVSRFFEFFMISPVAMDPYGIVGKLDHLIKSQHDRFSYFVGQVAPKLDKEKQASLEMGLAGGITVHEISKIVRHYVELVKKTKSLQIAMILQMQLPMIEKIAKGMFKGTGALTDGKPIGDGLGPLVASELMGDKKAKEIEKDILMTEINIEGRRALVLKARGPGGRIGYPGKAVKSLVDKENVSRVITVDAAAKLEGEKTGSIAEGVGVAMGGPGVERSYIEEIVVKKNIPLDSIVVKMSPEQAIEPMRKAIKDAVPRVMESIKRSLERTKKGDTVVILGVGNSSGIGNSKTEIKKAKEWVETYERKLKAQNKKKKKGKD